MMDTDTSCLSPLMQALIEKWMVDKMLMKDKVKTIIHDKDYEKQIFGEEPNDKES